MLSKSIGVKKVPDPGSGSATLEMFIVGVEELEAEGGGPELVEQLSGHLNSQATAQNIEKLIL